MTLGFIGTGRITGAVVRGLCSGADPTEDTAEIIVSPRNAERADELSREFANVRVGDDNQSVVDASDTVFIAVLPDITQAVLQSLHFRPEHRVVSFVSTVVESDLLDWIGTVRSLTRAVPLPACANRRGPLLVSGEDEVSQGILARIGELVVVGDEDQLHRLWTTSGVIAPIYEILAAMSKWTQAGGIEAEVAERYIASMAESVCARRLDPESPTLQELAAESVTPGGLNEQAVRMIGQAGAPQAFAEALSALLHRFDGSPKQSRETSEDGDLTG